MPIVYSNFLDNPPSFDELFAELNTCGLLEDMCIVSKDKPILSRKTGSFLGIPDSNGGMPYLTCPSFFESYPMPDCVRNLLISKMKEKFDFNCNSIKVQHYILGKCGINPHSDKLLDLNPGKSIFVYRVNSENKPRSIWFRSKSDPNDCIEYMLDNNTLLEITWEDNLKYVHFVPEFENDCSHNCISFVLRDVQTFILPNSKFKYGIGAKFSTYDERMENSDIEPINMRDSVQKLEIVRMYNFENTHDMSINTFDYSLVKENTV